MANAKARSPVASWISRRSQAPPSSAGYSARRSAHPSRERSVAAAVFHRFTRNVGQQSHFCNQTVVVVKLGPATRETNRWGWRAAVTKRRQKLRRQAGGR